jgi:hypothetical protein
MTKQHGIIIQKTTFSSQSVNVPVVKDFVVNKVMDIEANQICSVVDTTILSRTILPCLEIGPDHSSLIVTRNHKTCTAVVENLNLLCLSATAKSLN